MASAGPVFSFSGTPTITTAKLNWKNYLSWFASVELWFLGQGYHDHLEKGVGTVPNDKKSEWEKLDFQLSAVLWQSVELNFWKSLDCSKHVALFGKRPKRYLPMTFKVCLMQPIKLLLLNKRAMI